MGHVLDPTICHLVELIRHDEEELATDICSHQHCRQEMEAELASFKAALVVLKRERGDAIPDDGRAYYFGPGKHPVLRTVGTPVGDRCLLSNKEIGPGDEGLMLLHLGNERTERHPVLMEAFREAIGPVPQTSEEAQRDHQRHSNSQEAEGSAEEDPG